MCYLSVVIPVYNSEQSLMQLNIEIAEALKAIQYEVILINDGSKDNSLQVAKTVVMNNKNVKIINLARNFGQHNAIMAGLHHTKGELVVLMDDDLQNPPKEIMKLLEEIEQGYDVCYGRYSDKKHHWFRNLGSKFNDMMATLLIQKPRNLYFCSFKMMRRFVVDEIVKYNSAYPYIDGLIFRTTQNISSVLVEHQERKLGQSNYTLRQLLRLWLNMCTNFSILPLRLATVFGFMIAISSFVFGFFVFVQKLWLDSLPPGWASLMISIMLLCGVQLACIGLLGEYLGRMYLSINQTPQFVVKETISFKMDE